MGFSVSFRIAALAEVIDGAWWNDASVGDDAASCDYEVLVMEACTALSEAEIGRFHLGGFGCAEWPVDVAYDLSVFMEQFPPLMASLDERREFELDMCSQGIERSLIFLPDAEEVVVRCRSRTDWTPDPEVENISRSDLLAMLSELAANFAVGLRVVRSPLLDPPP